MYQAARARGMTHIKNGNASEIEKCDWDETIAIFEAILSHLHAETELNMTPIVKYILCYM